MHEQSVEREVGIAAQPEALTSHASVSYRKLAERPLLSYSFRCIGAYRSIVSLVPALMSRLLS